MKFQNKQYFPRYCPQYPMGFEIDVQKWKMQNIFVMLYKQTETDKVGTLLEYQKSEVSSISEGTVW